MLKQLTNRAEERLAAIADAAEEAQALVRTITNRINETTHAIRHVGETEVEQIAALERELERHRQRLTAAQTTFAAQSRVHAAVRSWLSGMPKSVVLDDCDDEHAELRSGEDYQEATVRVRADIEQLASARSAIARAVLPVDELVEQAYAHVDALVARGRPPLRLDRDKLIVGAPPDHVSMLAWLFPDDMKDGLRFEIEEQRKRETHPNLVVLSAKERDQKLRALDEVILKHERQEEALISEAGEFGTVIQRRERASPLAILGLRVVQQRQRVAA